MPRTVVYPTLQRTKERPIEFGGSGTEPPVTETGLRADTYAEKLAKFIPAETVAFFAPVASMMEERPPLLIAAAIIGALATPAYMWTSARRLSPELQPRWHFYVLSTIAFGAWALGTSRLGSIIGIDSVTSAFILGTAVFVLPLIDSLMSSS